MTQPRFDPNLLAYLQAWRQYLEQLASSATLSIGVPTLPQWPAPAAPPPVMPPAFAAPPPYPPAPATDYTQQLLATLAAWRQYLEHSMPTPAAATPPVPVGYPDPTPAREAVPPSFEGGTEVARPPSIPPAAAAPVRRAGSAYAAETESQAYGGTGIPTPRSLYGGVAAPDTGSPGTTTTWWDDGRPPPGTPLPQANPSADATGTGHGVRVPPDLETQAPMIYEGSSVAQLQAVPGDQLVQPSFDRTRSR